MQNSQGAGKEGGPEQDLPRLSQACSPHPQLLQDVGSRSVWAPCDEVLVSPPRVPLLVCKDPATSGRAQPQVTCAAPALDVTFRTKCIPHDSQLLPRQRWRGREGTSASL